MSDIFSYVEEQEVAYRQPIYLDEEWKWSMREHIRSSYLYKNSQFFEKNDDRKLKPFINIIRPVLNIHYRTEGFDVKDIEIYVDNPATYYKSFLIKKYHDKWVLENEIDTFIDELVESYVDYGGVLVKNVRGIRPEVVDLRTLAFCDQTNILSSPFAIKHYYTPEQLLKEKGRGWGDTNKGSTVTLEDLVKKAEAQKDVYSETVQNKTPGKYVEVYELHNCSEADYKSDASDETYMTILAFYKDESEQKHGVILFRSKEPKNMFKFLARDNVQGRALGFGAIEELYEAQRWTNFTEITEIQQLQQASKILYTTTDPKFKGQNLSSKKMGEVIDIQQDRQVAQLDSVPRSFPQFEQKREGYKRHANEIGAAGDVELGQQPHSGTPFKSVEIQLVEGKSLHRWRQGKIAVFVGEIYREWIIPHLAKEVTNGTKFLSELSMEEMQEVGRAMVNNVVNKRVAQLMFAGKVIYPFEVDFYRQEAERKFLEGGSKKFIEILKGELADEKLDVRTNIAGKQKNLALLTDKLVNYVRQLLATPEARQDPAIIKHVNEILEYAGMSPIQYGISQPAIAGGSRGSNEALKDLGETAKSQLPKQLAGT